MKKCKRMLALVSSILMMATSFALPYGAVAEEATPETPAAAYPNADPSEPYYVVARFQEKGEVAKDESEVKPNADTTGEYSDTETYPNKCTEGNIDLNKEVNLSAYSDKSKLALVVDTKVSRTDGTTGADALKETGNQYFWLFDGNTRILSAGYLREITTNYFTSAGETLTYVIPLSQQSNINIENTSTLDTITKLSWHLYNDTWKAESTNRQAVGVQMEMQNARIVDLTRDGNGYKNGVVAQFVAEDPAVKSSGEGEHSPTLLDNAPARYQAIPENAGPAKLRLEMDILVSGEEITATSLINGKIELKKDDEAIGEYGWSTEQNPAIKAMNTWTHYTTTLDSFKNLTSENVANVNKVRVWTYNDTKTADGTTNTDRALTAKVKNVKIVDTTIADLRKAVLPTRASLYDDTYAKAMEQAKAVLLKDAPTDEEIAVATTALTKGAIADHSNTVVASIAGWKDKAPKKQGDQTLKFDWGDSEIKDASGSTYVDMTDGKTYTVNINLASGGTTEEVRGVIGANRYAVVTVTMTAAAPDLTKMTLRLRSKAINQDNAGADGKGTDERRTNKDYTFENPKKVTNTNGSVTYTFEGLIDATGDDWTGADGNSKNVYDRRLDWRTLNAAQGIFRSADDDQLTAAQFVSADVQFEDRTVQVIQDQVSELATLKGDFLPGEEWDAFAAEQTKAAKLLADYQEGDPSATLMALQAEAKTLAERKAKLVNLDENVVVFSDHAKNKQAGPQNWNKSDSNNPTASTYQFYFDWRNGDGLDNVNIKKGQGNAIDLTYGKGDDSPPLAEDQHTGDNTGYDYYAYPGFGAANLADNLYFQAKVTIEKGEAWKEDVDFDAKAMKKFDFRLRSSDSYHRYNSNNGEIAKAEMRTASIKQEYVTTRVEEQYDNSITYFVECAITKEAFGMEGTHVMDWTDLRASIIFVDLPFSVTRADNAKSPASCKLSDVKIVNKSKELLKKELEAAATETGVYADNEALKTYLAAQEAAKELLQNPSATYTELKKALDTINTAKAELKAVGHTVKTFDGWNREIKNGLYANGGKAEVHSIYNDWLHSNDDGVDLSKYDPDHLYLRINVKFGYASDAKNTDNLQPLSAVKTARLSLQSKNLKEGYTGSETDEPSYNLPQQEIQWGDNALEVPLKALFSDNKIDTKTVRDIIMITFVDQLKPADYNTMTEEAKNEYRDQHMGEYSFTFSNARIVDTTAEENLGTVNVEGNGYVEIIGGLVNGATDTLTAKTTSDNAKFAAWNVNGTYIDGEAIELPVDGKQNVTAVFVDKDATVVKLAGKYNKVFAIKGVKSGQELHDLLTTVEVPDVAGYTPGNWSESIEDIGELDGLIKSAKDTGLTITRYYVQDETQTGFTVTLGNGVVLKTPDNASTTPNETTGLQELRNQSFDTRIEVNAAAPDGKTFSHWELDGMYVGNDSENYRFYVSGNNLIEAVFVDADDQPVAPKPQAAVKQIIVKDDVNDTGKYTISVIAQTFLPDGCGLNHYGVIFAPGKSYLDRMVAGQTVDTSMYVDIASKNTILNRQFMMNLNKVNPGKTRYAVAYVTYTDNTGEHTVYSDIVSATTPSNNG